MKTLRVTLADIIGPTGTPNSTATVHARYVDTSGRGRDVHLTDGTIVVPVRRTVAPGTVPQHFDFDVYANDAAPVREVDYGHLVEVSWTVVAPTGAKSSGVKRVPITDSMASVVQLGLLAQPAPVPPYTGGYALAPDLAAEVVTRAAADAALDGRVDALEAHAVPDVFAADLAAHAADTTNVHGITDTGALVVTTDPRLSDARDPTAHEHALADVTDVGTAAAADVGDFATAAQGAKADNALQPNTVTGLLAGNGTTTTGRTITGTADEITVANGSGASGNPTLSLALTAAKVGALPIPDPGSFYPTDTIAAALQLIGGRGMYGTGSPEGVVTAPIGTYYTDTAITNGALRWAKKTGTGNTGWQVIEGDTGWRDIRALYSENVVEAAAFSLSSRIIRVGDTVQYLGRVKPSGAVVGVARANVAGIQGVISTIPAGFTPLPSDNGPKGSVSVSQVMQGQLANTASTSRLDLYMSASVAGVWAGTDVIFLSGSWPTRDAWPATLPGVAA